MATNFALEGRQAADKESYFGWLLFGALLGLIGPVFAHIMTPVPRPEVLAKGPTDSGDQQMFVGLYIRQAKNLRVKHAWLGCALSFVLYTVSCGACMMLGIVSVPSLSEVADDVWSMEAGDSPEQEADRTVSAEDATPGQAALAAIGIPFEDLAGVPELGDCSAESRDYYYGVGRPVDYEKARCAAFREFADGARGPFSGAGMLMMLYANGYGVEQNLDLAIRLSRVTIGPVDYESDLQTMRTNAGAGEFDVCHLFTGGPFFGICMSIGESRASAEWTLRMRRLIDDDEPLRRLMDEFIASRLENEIERSGSAGRYENPALEESFLNAFHAVSLELFAAGRFPTYTEEQFREADRELNRIYSELRVRESWPFGDSPEELRFEDVRETQRLWLRYRDAWAEFGRRRYPDVSTSSWLGWLTTWRNRQLDAIGETPPGGDYWQVAGDTDTEVRRQVEETLVPGS